MLAPPSERRVSCITPPPSAWEGVHPFPCPCFSSGGDDLCALPPQRGKILRHASRPTLAGEGVHVCTPNPERRRMFMHAHAPPAPWRRMWFTLAPRPPLCGRGDPWALLPLPQERVFTHVTCPFSAGEYSSMCTTTPRRGRAFTHAPRPRRKCVHSCTPHLGQKDSSCMCPTSAQEGVYTYT